MPDAFVYGRIAAQFGLTVQELDAKVHEAMEGTKRAAAAVGSDQQPWAQVVAAAGIFGLIGLIGFAVAALLSDDDDGGEPPKGPTRPG